MNRAYSLLTVKAVNEETRTITGIATTPMPDRIGDIVEPMGAQFQLPMPLLWQHDSHQPIGYVTSAKVGPDGIEVKAEIANVSEPGTLKNRLDEAWQYVKSGLVPGLSIGFKALESAQIKDTFNLRFMKWLWLELSVVTIPANEQATIQIIKAIDTDLRTLSSPKRTGIVRLTPSAGAGKSSKPTPQEGISVKTISEQVSALEAKRAASVAAQQALAQKGVDADRTMDADEAEQFDHLQAEIETVDKQLDRCRKLEKTMAATAKPIVFDDVRSASDVRGTPIISVKAQPKLAPGIGFARIAKCVALSARQYRDPAAIAEQLWGPDSDIVGIFKTGVVGGATLSGNWAANLVGTETSVFADFAEFLRPMTILGKFGTGGIPSLRAVPFRVALVSQTAGGSGYWVGEGKAKPLTLSGFDRVTLAPLKVANIAVLTEEVIRDSSPKAEVIIRDTLAAALRERLDTDFVDPSLDASANVSPASITFGAPTVGSSGNTQDDVFTDVRTLMQAFINANNPPSTGVFIMSTSNALALNMMQNPLGQRAFPDITMQGGSFFGLPVISSEYVDDNVILVNASDIYFADDGDVTVDVSRDASLLMDDNAGASMNSTTPTGAQVVSMFQTNSVALRAERTLNWAARRDSAVAYLTSVAWGGAVSI